MGVAGDSKVSLAMRPVRSCQAALPHRSRGQAFRREAGGNAHGQPTALDTGLN